MTRSAEAALLGAAVVIAAMGVALVNFATGGWLDAQVALDLLHRRHLRLELLARELALLARLSRHAARARE